MERTPKDKLVSWILYDDGAGKYEVFFLDNHIGSALEQHLQENRTAVQWGKQKIDMKNMEQRCTDTGVEKGAAVKEAEAQRLKAETAETERVAAVFEEYMTPDHRHPKKERTSTIIFKNKTRKLAQDSGFLGTVNSLSDYTENEDCTQKAYLNVNEPFCFIATGIQGSGKSHTVAVIIENCLLQCRPMMELRKPLAALVLHYDQAKTECEAIGLGRTAPELLKLPLHKSVLRQMSVKEIVVLVSPSFYKQRSTFYSELRSRTGTKYKVYPLLFSWENLRASELKKLLLINDGDSQLYVSMLLDQLRLWQRKGTKPPFATFFEEILEGCNPTQKHSLRQRFAILEQFVAESDINKTLVCDIKKELGDIDWTKLVQSGTLIVIDLVNPMMSPAEANGVFQVVVAQFRATKVPCGKLLVADEAHKYFDSKRKGGDGLAAAMVETVRMMRHEGTRVVISTQSPLTMPPELLELSTVVACHQFQSQDWYTHMTNKLPLPDCGFSIIRHLRQGHALLYSTHAEDDKNLLVVHIRRRLTDDLGFSRINSS